MIGTTVAGRYEIQAQIGVGGMGIVYRAHDARLRRNVALKVIAPHLMQQDSARTRFLREAQALAGLMHPNIVTIFDMAEDDASNTVFLVMELLSGHSLRQFLSDETCPQTADCPRFSHVALPLCRALEAAHKQGVLHRDIKPENIFVCDDGTLKLMDFGLARLLGDMSKNQSSTVAGTLAYMAPEQLRGEKLDARTDLYALGAVFFEFVTGTQPFMGDNPGTVLLKHLTEAPPHLGDRLPDTTNDADAHILNVLDDLITHLMAKDAGERPASANEVRGVLEQPQKEGGTLALAVDRMTAALGARSAAATEDMTRFMPPVSLPAEAIAARMTSRQTVEQSQAEAQQTTIVPQPTSPVLIPAVTNAPAVAPLPETPPTVSVSPVWKRRGIVVAGVSLLSAASVLAAVRFRPHADTTSTATAISPVSSKPRDADIRKNPATVLASSGSPIVAVPNAAPAPSSTPTLVGKTTDFAPHQKNRAPATPNTSRAATNAAKTPPGKTAAASRTTKNSAVTSKSTPAPLLVTAAELEASRREAQAEIRKLQKQLETERAHKTSTLTPAKSGGHETVSGTPGTTNSAKPVKLPPLPSVADEAIPPLAIGMKVARVERSDNKAIHLSLQNDVDCYAYFYLIPPQAKEAMRLFADYQYFGAMPKTPYTIRLLLPHEVASSRGAVLIVAAKKELKNLPTSFPLPLPQPQATTPVMSREQRQQIGRQNIHAFSDQVAQELAASHVLQGGQLLQAHQVVVRPIGNNPMIFGRSSDGSRRNPEGTRRGPGQPLFRGRRNFPPPAEY